MCQGDPLDQIQEVLTVPLRWELVRYRVRGLGPHCSSGTGRKLEIQEEAGFLGNWKSEESGQSEVRDQGRVRVFGDIRGILCCRRHCRRLADESSSLVAEVPRGPGSCCIREPRGDPRSLREGLQHLQVSGLEGRMEDSPGRAGQPCLDGGDEVEVDRMEVQRMEDHQVLEDSCCSWCVEDGEAEGIGQSRPQSFL